MTPKQARFVTEYIKDHCGKQAAIRAGYSEKSAESQASQLLKLPKVAEAIAKADGKAAENAGITREWVLRGLKRHAEEAQAEAVSLKAYELAGKVKGLDLFGPDKHEVTGAGGTALTVQVVTYTGKDDE